MADRTWQGLLVDSTSQRVNQLLECSVFAPHELPESGRQGRAQDQSWSLEFPAPPHLRRIHNRTEHKCPRHADCSRETLHYGIHPLLPPWP